MNKNSLRRDFTFEQWQQLSSDEKSYIYNHYWNPYEPGLGKKTRQAIVNEFKNQHPELSDNAIEIGYKYFGWYVGCIYVLIENSRTRVPQKFMEELVNKGVVLDKINDEVFLVKWRYGGKSEFRINEFNFVK